MTADHAQVAAVAQRLYALGARRGAFLILCNAAVQREAADLRDLSKWTPGGPLPLGRKPAEKLNAANDQDLPSASPSPVGGGL